MPIPELSVSNKIGVIGFGNIAKAIITPLLDKKLINPQDVYCLVNTKKTLNNLKKNYKYGINIFQANTNDSYLVWDCKVKLLSIKPQQLQDINEIQNNNSSGNLLVSILAGVSIEKLIRKFPNHSCARVVTNIPIIVGKGITELWGEKIFKTRKNLQRNYLKIQAKYMSFEKIILISF